VGTALMVVLQNMINLVHPGYQNIEFAICIPATRTSSSRSSAASSWPGLLPTSSCGGYPGGGRHHD